MPPPESPPCRLGVPMCGSDAELQRAARTKCLYAYILTLLSRSVRLSRTLMSTEPSESTLERARVDRYTRCLVWMSLTPCAPLPQTFHVTSCAGVLALFIAIVNTHKLFQHPMLTPYFHLRLLSPDVPPACNWLVAITVAQSGMVNNESLLLLTPSMYPLPLVHNPASLESDKLPAGRV